jgi:DNA-binding transcriptional LysR family regulator
LRVPAGVVRHDLLRDPVRLVLPVRHPAALRHRNAIPLGELADDAWTTGEAGMGWDEMTHRTCRALGGFAPDVRHRTYDATLSVALVARGLAVTLLPALALPRRVPGVAYRAIAEGPVERAIVAVTRAADVARPSIQALLGAIRDAVPTRGL